ncbi:MAG TPA: hypothetical protein VKU01_20990 [Bryobacteraceae bacterium]|nr:hypothetical protein [Bryobacteraceae bacterium]
MARALYWLLVTLHPPAFRRKFASEMLWIFEVSAGSREWLVWDGLVSLARQWVLRCGAWKWAAALLAALLQISAGGLLWIGGSSATGGGHHAELNVLLRWTLAVTGVLVTLVIAVSLWLRRFITLRSGGA